MKQTLSVFVYYIHIIPKYKNNSVRVRERDDQVGRKTNVLSVFHPWNLLFVLYFTLLRLILSVKSPHQILQCLISSGFYILLPPLLSQFKQAADCCLPVIDPRYEPHTSPISRLHICYFPDFYKNDHNWNETFFLIFYTQFNKTLQISFSVFHNQSPSISSSPCTHCLSILLLSASSKESKHISLIGGCFWGFF